MKNFSKLALSCILYMHTATAATTTWGVGTGDWDTAGNWTGGIPTAADTAVINNSGTAQLTVPPAGVASDVFLGFTVSSGNLLVDNQTLTIGNSFQIGGSSTAGNVTIQNGGAVSTQFCSIANGLLLLDGNTSTFTMPIGNTLFIARAGGPSTFTIQNGGVATGTGLIGDNNAGTANVKNSGSVWNASAGFQVGRDGTRFLNITDGGKVQAASAFIAFSTSGIGTATVSDPNSLWE